MAEMHDALVFELTGMRPAQLNERDAGIARDRAITQWGRLLNAAWISVDDDRKPALGQVILMWVYAADEGEDDDGRPYSMDKSQVQMGEYREMDHGPFFDCFATPSAHHEGVTHWMPLPHPPTSPTSEESGNG